MSSNVKKCFAIFSYIYYKVLFFYKFHALFVYFLHLVMFKLRKISLLCI